MTKNFKQKVTFILKQVDYCIIYLFGLRDFSKGYIMFYDINFLCFKNNLGHF